MMFGLLAAILLFSLGVLIGSGLHTQAVDERYRQVAHCVRDTNEKQKIAHFLATTASGAARHSELLHPPGHNSKEAHH